MTKGHKVFYLCMTLFFIVGFLVGVMASPLIMRSVFRMPFQPHGERFGKGPGGEDRMKEEFVDRLAKDLDLTDAQKVRVKATCEKHEAEMLSIRKDIQKSFDAFKTKFDSEIMTILDDKQKEKFKAMAKKFGGHGGPFMPPPPGSRDGEPGGRNHPPPPPN